MPMPEDEGYEPCANCGDEWSETLGHSGQPLCGECYNVWKCGCDLCVKVAVGEWFIQKGVSV